MAPLTFEALRVRFEADEMARRAGDVEGGDARLARALRAVGWSGTELTEAEEVAEMLASVVDACVTGHRDLATLYRDVADVLRHAGPLLDGSLPPVAAYLPAAEEVVARYAVDAG
ncbi:MAG TPA: hypothetical protein VEA99_01350 [Gemmatimonadaceae bacterium]|nr:hypothetical protein [Gemmatimonadaceae bacterium]